ncbi:MAG TPA: hypothetical protein VGO49_03825 [Bradyrhizobium sp.]|nr:hypothetical protein [Bradyrhizobium sp.]
MAIDIQQFIVAVAQVANGDPPAAAINAQGAKALVFFEVQPGMTRIRYKLRRRYIDPVLNVGSQLCIGFQEAVGARDPHRHS